MKFREKNDDGIEIHLEPNEIKLLYEALRFYSAYGKEKEIIDEIPQICEIMNVLSLPEFDKK